MRASVHLLELLSSSSGVVCCGPCSRGTLDLPGYDSSERVCEPCRKKVLGLRNYLNKNHELLINNMHHNRGEWVSQRAPTAVRSMHRCRCVSQRSEPHCSLIAESCRSYTCAAARCLLRPACLASQMPSPSSCTIRVMSGRRRSGWLLRCCCCATRTATGVTRACRCTTSSQWRRGSPPRSCWRGGRRPSCVA